MINKLSKKLSKNLLLELMELGYVEVDVKLTYDTIEKVYLFNNEFNEMLNCVQSSDEIKPTNCGSSIRIPIRKIEGEINKLDIIIINDGNAKRFWILDIEDNILTCQPISSYDRIEFIIPSETWFMIDKIFKPK